MDTAVAQASAGVVVRDGTGASSPEFSEGPTTIAVDTKLPGIGQEHLTFNQEVQGSNPCALTNLSNIISYLIEANRRVCSA